MTPAEFAGKLERFNKRFPSELDTAQKRVGNEAVKIAQKWSSGDQTTAQLRLDDHPYATRHAHAAQSGLINNQHDTFLDGWYFDPDKKQLRNEDPIGHFLQDGTWKMYARDILGAIRTDLQPIMRDEVRKAIKRSLRA